MARGKQAEKVAGKAAKRAERDVKEDEDEEDEEGEGEQVIAPAGDQQHDDEEEEEAAEAEATTAGKRRAEAGSREGGLAQAGGGKRAKSSSSSSSPPPAAAAEESGEEEGGDDAASVVVRYMRRANRPYSVNVVVENMHRAIGKAELQRCMDQLVHDGRSHSRTQQRPRRRRSSLTAAAAAAAALPLPFPPCSEKLSAKEFGKAKLYWIRQVSQPEHRRLCCYRAALSLSLSLTPPLLCWLPPSCQDEAAAGSSADEMAKLDRQTEQVSMAARPRPLPSPPCSLSLPALLLLCCAAAAVCCGRLLSQRSVCSGVRSDRSGRRA